MSDNKEETMDIMRTILSIFIPPLGVFLQVGFRDIHFWLNLVLTFLGYIPGIVHALFIIWTRNDSSIMDDVIK